LKSLIRRKISAEPEINEKESSLVDKRFEISNLDLTRGIVDIIELEEVLFDLN
jgi:hypothetical protein